MTRDQLATEISKRENKKVQVSIGNIREVLRILIDMQVEWSEDEMADYEKSPLFVLSEEFRKKVEAKAKKKPVKKKTK